MMEKLKKYFAISICCVIAAFPLLPNTMAEESVKIYFSADEVEENSKTEVITARGNVIITRNQISLRADEISYDRKNDVVIAKGNVSITSKDGSVLFADWAELTDKLSQGTIRDVKVILADQSRIAAQRIKQTESGNRYFFYGVYSPCDICDEDPKPLWQLKARKVTHDAHRENIYYRNAFIEVKDIPVFYTPFLSHPDPTVKRRSGFLAPTLRNNSYLGSSMELRYFWNISDHEDFLFNPIFTSDRGTILGGKYRKQLYNGRFDVSGSIMRDDDQGRNRGHVFAKGRYEIDDLWIAKLDINYASDGAYLKDLSLPGRTETWLTSKASFERFDVRDYAAIEAYHYKLVSYSLREYNHAEYQRREYSKPYVMPLTVYETIGDSNSIGAYWKTHFSTASVYRERSETGSQRATMINSWNLPYTSPFGEKYRFVTSVKSDAYYIHNYQYENNNEFTDSTGRIFPQAGLEWRLPFVKATEDSRQIVEPIIVAVAAPNGGNRFDKIPNEDSLNAQLDDTNILSLDRYSGYDRNDTGSRLSYGLNWSSYGNIIGRTSMFVAQSYYLSDDESFSRSTGEQSYFSDYVGRIHAAPHPFLDLNYRFRADKDNFELKYNEINARVGNNMLSTNIAFISLTGRRDINNSSLYFFDDYAERKELYTAVSAKISRDWRLNVYNRHDLTKGGVGSLEHGGRVIYEDECFNLVFDVHKYNSTDPDYKDGYDFSVTFILKTLGGTGSK